jgi:small-conductance mechanosensitive channel
MSISSNVRFKINDAFRQNGVVIPFPQRDLHLRSGTIHTPEN